MEQKTVELTNKEIEMITTALDYFGDKIADKLGYSSGEKYWDLMNKLKEI